MATENESPVQDETVKCKILILGAGMAGLSAASLLAKNGVFDFFVLEARERIGGRIAAADIGSGCCKLEMGANWIHGVLGNPIYEMAVINNLVEIIQIPKPHKVVAASEDGKQVPFALLQEIYEAYMCFLHRCEEYFLCHYLPPQGIDSVGDHIELEIALYLDKIEDPQEKKLKRLIFDCLLKRETCISGCDKMSDIDLLELGSYTELQGGNITLPKGYSSILEPASKDIPEDKILKNHVVTCVKWSGADWKYDESDLNSNDSEKTVIEEGEREAETCDESLDTVDVFCENGRKFTANHVICTLPLGVLKEKVETLFSPPLPPHKLEAIDKLMFGTVNKIFLGYERPFLHPEISEVMLLWTNDDSQDNVAENWHKKIYSFSKVTETVLLGWISGKEAEYMETLTENEISEKCTEILRKFLNDPFVPKPKHCICSKWKSEPFTRGSYTAMAIGASQCDIENLAQPLFSKSTDEKPTILFAGEHTHSNFYSTVHGAYLSGRACAQELMETQPAITVGDTDLSSWIRGISLDDYSV